MYFEVLPAKVFKKSPLLEDGILTYTFDQNLPVGTIVEIPLGKTTTVGVIYRKINHFTADFKVKSIIRPLYDTPLPSHLLKSIIWLSEYYLTPLPQVVNLFLPGTLSNRHKLAQPVTTAITPSTSITLNSAQEKAVASLIEAKPNTKLLHGITGSGKTNIYLSFALEAFKNGRSTILLVPEIALTSQLVTVFQQTFSKNIVLIHSKQTTKTRRDNFEQLLLSTTPKIIIGPRSALFAPIKNLGLIIIDEAHEPTYFQDQAPKYSALRLASFIAKTLDIFCIQGTATPKIEDYYLAKSHQSLVTLTEKAKSTAIQPEVKIIDFKDRSLFTENRYFSSPLLAQIRTNLNHQYQTLIYHNRRGSAPLTICENCGWQALCKNCFLPLTLHSDSYQLICHTCGYQTKIPTSCPECHHPEVIHKGFGTKLLESELRRLFKTAKIARFDGDNDKKNSLDALYEQVKSGDIDIIIGTQTIAKGLDLPKLATIGIVQADSGLSLPDFSTEERTFSLINQVLGRIGRGHLSIANAYIQTFHPDDPAINYAIQSNYAAFYDYLIQRRKTGHFPPFTYLAKLSVVYKTERAALAKIKSVHQALRSKPNIYLSAPTPAFHEHTSSGFCWQIVVKSGNRQSLLAAIRSLDDFPDLRISIDPPSLL